MLRNGAESTINEWGAACCDHDGTKTCRPPCGHATVLVCTRFVSSIRCADVGSTTDTGTGTYCCGGTWIGAAPPTTTCFVGLQMNKENINYNHKIWWFERLINFTYKDFSTYLGIVWYPGWHNMLDINWCGNSFRVFVYWRPTFRLP